MILVATILHINCQVRNYWRGSGVMFRFIPSITIRWGWINACWLGIVVDVMTQRFMQERLRDHSRSGHSVLGDCEDPEPFDSFQELLEAKDSLCACGDEECEGDCPQADMAFDAYREQQAFGRSIGRD